MTESEQATPWGKLQRSPQLAPCLQAGLSLNRPRHSLAWVGPFAWSAPVARESFVLTPSGKRRPAQRPAPPAQEGIISGTQACEGPKACGN